MGIFFDMTFQYWQVEFEKFTHFRDLYLADTSKKQGIRYTFISTFTFYLFTFLICLLSFCYA